MQQYLSDHSANPNDDKDPIPVQSLDNVSLTVNLACIHFIKERHHDERVEDNGHVLWRELVMLTVFNVEEACT